MLGKDTGKEADLLHRSLPRQASNTAFYFVCPSIPMTTTLTVMKNPGAFYKGEKTILLTRGQTMRKPMNISSYFLLLFWVRVEWAEEREKWKARHEITKPTTIPHTVLMGVLSPQLLQRGQKEPRNVSVPFQGTEELWGLAPKTLFLTL